MNILFGATGKLGLSLQKKADIKVSRRRLPGFELCDYSNECLKEIMKGGDRIIIATGSTKTYNKEELWEANVRITKRIVDNAPKDALIVLSSSISVYGKNLKGLVNEKTPIDPDTEYAKTKLAAEKIVEKKDGLILRLGTLYGKQFNDYYYILKLIEQGRMRIIGKGNNHIPFTHVEDVVDCFFKDAKGTYVVSGKGVMQKKVLEKAAELLGVEKPKRSVPYWFAYLKAWIEEMKGKPKITREHIAILGKDRRFDCKKARRELGFKERDFFEGLKEMVRAYKGVG